MDKPIDENADLEPHQIAALTPAEKKTTPSEDTTIPVAPHPTTNRYPWPSVENPKVAGPEAQAAPELPPAKEPATPAEPIATAAIVAYDADLDQRETHDVQDHPSKEQTISPQQSAIAPEKAGPTVSEPAPPAHHRAPAPKKHTVPRSGRPVKLYSQSTQRVWRSRRFARQYKAFTSFFVVGAVAAVIGAWVAVGSPTNLESFLQIFDVVSR